MLFVQELVDLFGQLQYQGPSWWWWAPVMSCMLGQALILCRLLVAKLSIATAPICCLADSSMYYLYQNTVSGTCTCSSLHKKQFSYEGSRSRQPLHWCVTCSLGYNYNSNHVSILLSIWWKLIRNFTCTSHDQTPNCSILGSFLWNKSCFV